MSRAIHFGLFVVAMAAGWSAIAGPAHGAEEDSDRKVPAALVVTEAMIPYLYQYGACVFGGAGEDVDARIAGCQTLKAQLQLDAVEPHVFWHRGKGPTRKRQFVRAFDLLEEEARILERRYGPVPRTIIDYMNCIGSNIARSDDFVAGRTIEYLQFDGGCRAWAKLSVEDASDLERRLYQGVRRSGRIIRPPLAPIIAYRLNKGLIAGHYY